MAQYDGSIRINTQINTKSAEINLATLENRIVKTSDKITSLRSKMNALKNQKIPTEEFKKLQKELDSATKEMEKMVAQDSKLADIDTNIKKLSQSSAEYAAKMKEVSEQKIPTYEYSKMQKELSKAEKNANSLYEKLRVMEKSGDTSSKGFARLKEQIKNANQLVSELRNGMSELERSGKAFTLGTDTEQYKNLSAKYESVNAELEKQKGLHSEIAQKQANAVQKTIGLKAQMNQLVAEGKAFTIGSDTEQFAKLGQQLRYAEEDLSLLNQKHGVLELKLKKAKGGYAQLGAAAKKSFSAIGNMLKKVNSHIKSFANKVKEVAQRYLPFFRKEAEKTKSSVSSFGKRLKSLALSLLVFNQISKAFREISNGIKEGISNLYNENEKFKNSIDSLKASALTLKNALAAAFSPIIQVAIPYVRKLIDYMTQLINLAGQFFAAITGRKTYIKAIKQTTEALEEETKAMNKQLSPLDDLNNLTSESGSNASAGSGGTMFEEVPIDSNILDMADKFKDLVQWLKDMWEKSDFYELGKKIGEWLKNALDSIPWGEIKKAARKLAKSFATLINGFIEVEGLGYSIGKTLAEAINTAFEFLNEFVHRLHWASIGHFIADTLNGFFESIDWEVMRDTFVTGFTGFANAINQLIADFHWDNISDSLSNLVNIITESVYTFFSETNFDELGKRLGEQLRKSIEKIDWEELGRALGSVVQSALDFLLNFVIEQDMSEIAQAVIDTLKGFFSEVDVEDLATVILTVIAAKLALVATAGLFEIAAGAILKALGEAILLSKIGLATVARLIISGIYGAFMGLTELGAAFAGELLNFIKVGLSTTGKAFADIGALIISGIQGGIASAGGLANILTLDMAALAAEGGAATTGVLIGGSIIGGIAGALGGGVLGKLLDNYILAPLMSFDEELSEEYKNFKWFGEDGALARMKESFTDGSWKEALDLWGQDINDGLDALFGVDTEPFYKTFGEIKDSFTDGTWKEAFDLWGDDIYDAFVTLGERQSEVWDSIKTSIKTKFEEIKTNVFGKLNQLKTKWYETWDSFKTKISNAFSSIKSAIQPIIDWIGEKIQWIIDKFSGIGGKIAGMFGGGFGGTTSGSKSRAAAYSTQSISSPYAAYPSLMAAANVPIPALARGAVIPANREFLAVLGDQKHGTNIEAPLETIKQAQTEALMEVFSKLGMAGGGQQEINLNVTAECEGAVLFRIIEKYAEEYKKQHGGKIAFT